MLNSMPSQPMQEICKEHIQEWEKKGELLIIWKCEKCGKEIPFYKSGNEFIDGIYLWWVRDHKFCRYCAEGRHRIKKADDRINKLLQTYEYGEENGGCITFEI